METICNLANDGEVVRRLGRLPFPYRAEDALFFLDQIVPHELVWIIEKQDDCNVVGIIGLTPRDDVGKVELGYWLGRQFWELGFATEAAKMVLNYAFGPASLPEIISGCFDDNVRSARVLNKLGFNIVSKSMRSCLAEGKELPHLDARLSREEWKSD